MLFSRILSAAFLLSPLSCSAIKAPSKAQTEVIKLDRNEGSKMQETCDVQVNFGSYGSGANMKSSRVVESYLPKAKHVEKAYKWPWGREGEHIYCLMSKTPKKAFNEFKGLLPKTSDSGSIELSQKGGESLLIENPRHSR